MLFGAGYLASLLAYKIRTFGAKEVEPRSKNSTEVPACAIPVSKPTKDIRVQRFKPHHQCCYQYLHANCFLVT